MANTDILREQLDYYRARAGEYDEWWYRMGRLEHAWRSTTADPDHMEKQSVSEALSERL